MKYSHRVVIKYSRYDVYAYMKESNMTDCLIYSEIQYQDIIIPVEYTHVQTNKMSDALMLKLKFSDKLADI